MKPFVNVPFLTAMCFLSFIGCSKSSKIHQIQYAVDTSSEGANWTQTLAGNASDPNFEMIHSKFLKSIREEAYLRCLTDLGLLRVRAYLVRRNEPIDRATDQPEFDMTCEEVRAKKAEWGITGGAD